CRPSPGPAVRHTVPMSTPDDDPQLLHIGAVAERTELSLRTLRHHDEIGLITPSERSSGGFRLYSEADVERILLIRRMKPLDFTLEQMRCPLEVTEAATRPDCPDAGRHTPRDCEETVIERRAALERKVAMVDEFLARMQEMSPDG